MRSDVSSSQPSVRALERGIDILDCLRLAGAPLPLTAVAETVGLSPSTTLRILVTLEKKHYLVRNEDTKHYSLGPSALRLGGSSRSVESLTTLSLRPLQELNVIAGESTSVYIPSGDRRVCIQRVESNHPLRQVINIGDSLSLTIGAGGKVLTAWLELSPNYDVSRLVPPLSPALLAQIREAGYATSFNERAEGVYAVAAPVFDSSGNILATLTVSGPTARFDAEKLPATIEAVKEKAREVSVMMGWKG